MVNYIKQYGIQRSCTNFVKVLLENNLEDTVVLTNILGWKHGPHKDKIDWEGNDWNIGQNLEEYVSSEELLRIKNAYKEEKIHYIICLKDPYAWLMSYSKYMNRQDKVRSLGGLVSEGKKFVARKRGVQLNEIGEYLENWNMVHQNWANLIDKNQKCASTKFEDLLKNTQSEVERLSTFFNAKMKDEFYIPEKKMRRGGEKMAKENSTENVAFDKEYYEEKKYLSHFNDEMLAEVRKHIDHDIAVRLGYDII
tara:strand:+ start:1464 stop:2219 length:756 start_codon:yes stop_codon:yes gene_type:complete